MSCSDLIYFWLALNVTMGVLCMGRQNDWTPPKCGELSEYTASVLTRVDDFSSRCMNGSKVCNRCGHNIKHFHPSSTVCKRTGLTE